MNVNSASQLLAQVPCGLKSHEKATKAAGMNITPTVKKLQGEPSSYHVSPVPATVRTMTSRRSWRPTNQTLTSGSSRWNPSKCSKELRLSNLLRFEWAAAGVILSQNRANHHRWSLEYHWLRSAYQGRCKYYPKTACKSSISKRTHQGIPRRPHLQV